MLWEDEDQVPDMKNTVKQQHNKNNKKMGCNSSSSKEKTALLDRIIRPPTTNRSISGIALMFALCICIYIVSRNHNKTIKNTIKLK